MRSRVAGVLLVLSSGRANGGGAGLRAGQGVVSRARGFRRRDCDTTEGARSGAEWARFATTSRRHTAMGQRTSCWILWI